MTVIGIISQISSSEKQGGYLQLEDADMEKVNDIKADILLRIS